MRNHLNLQSVTTLLTNFDVGGVNPSHTVEGQATRFKSLFGGLISTIMVALSLCYTFYICQLYYTNKLIPKSQISQKSLSYQEINFDYNPLTIFMVTNSKLRMPDPFQQDKIILIPSIQVVQNLAVIKTGQLLPETYIDKVNNFSLTVLNLQQQPNFFDINTTLIHDQDGGMNETQISVSFLKCVPYLLVGNQKCANQTQMDAFFAIPLKVITVRVNFKQFNQTSLGFDIKTKSYYFLFDESQALYTQIVLRTKIMTVENLMPFQQKWVSTFLSSVEVQPETVSKDYFKRYFLVESYANFLIRLDSIQDSEQLAYPLYGEVLAQISPVIHIIFWLKLIICFYNSRQYQNKLVDMIMSQNQTQVQGQNQTKPQIQLSEEKLSALSRINIFNIHMELYSMRQILDQIVMKQQEKDDIKIDPQLNPRMNDVYEQGLFSYQEPEQSQFENSLNEPINDMHKSYQVFPITYLEKQDNKINKLQKGQKQNPSQQIVKNTSLDAQVLKVKDNGIKDDDIDENDDIFFPKPKYKHQDKGLSYNF